MGPVLLEIGSGEDYIAQQVREYKGGPEIDSIDGTVTTNREAGLTTLNTPHAQAAVGFLGKAGPVTLADSKIESTNEHLGVAVVALDDQPIAKSQRLLVQLAPRVRPTGWKVEKSKFESKKADSPVDGWKILNTGTTPFRAEKVEGTITLNNPNLTKATVLDPAGKPQEEIPLKKEGGAVSLELPATAFYVILE